MTDVVIAMRVQDQAEHVAGATVRHCFECGMAVWFAPSSPSDAKVMCIQCARDLVDWDDPDNEIVPVSAEQIKELNKFRKSS